MTRSGEKTARGAIRGDRRDDRPKAQVRALGQAISQWGSEAPGGSRRPDLPWRSTRDPWPVLVSEVMTQQTQVTRVVPSYRRFLELFPTPGACAAAPLAEVLRAWQGLGYNRRARQLHLAATAIVADHGGQVPEGLAALESLPGVGPYTARAVLTFAFGHDVGVLDTNAGRVVARAAAGRSLTRSEAQRLVDAMVPPGHGWQFNQALLDLGATQCVAGVPQCAGCPVLRRCRWARQGRVEPDPASGSAAVSKRQAAFAGSDRQGRGRLVEALRSRSVRPDEVAVVMGWPDHPERASGVVERLVVDGLVVRDATGVLSLPGDASARPLSLG
jgi:A/G-specific adenine glycosylase